MNPNPVEYGPETSDSRVNKKKSESWTERSEYRGKCPEEKNKKLKWYREYP